MIQQVTISNFNRGVHTDENLALDGYVRETQGIDIYGTGAGTFANSPHRPGIYMPSQRMIAESEGAVSAGKDVQDLMSWIVPYSSRTYGLSPTSAAHLYVTESVPSTDTTQTWYLVSSLSSATGGGGLIPFGSNLYYGQNSVLGKTDATATNNNFKAFTDTTVTPRPMKIFGGKLCIGNGRYIATLDSDETTFNATALTLPVGFAIRSMDIWNGNLAIAADYTPTGATNPTASSLFLYNGTDPTFTQNLELPFTSAPVIVSHDNLLWIFGGDGSQNGIVFVFNGAQLDKAYFLPNVVWANNGCTAKFQSNILISTNGRTVSDEGGIWTIGRGGVEKPYAPSMSHIHSPASITGTNGGALWAESNNILAAWYDGTNYGIDRSSNALFPQTGGLIQTLPIHFGTPTIQKTFLSIKPDLESVGTTTGSTFQILYRTDLGSSSFVALKTINASDSNLNPNIPLRGIHGRRIEFQFKWVTTANAPLRLRSFTVYFSPQGKSK